MCNKPLFWLVDLYMNLPEYNKQVSFCCKYLSLILQQSVVVIWCILHIFEGLQSNTSIHCA